MSDAKVDSLIFFAYLAIIATLIVAAVVTLT
jgi:hypothetical protein